MSQIQPTLCSRLAIPKALPPERAIRILLTNSQPIVREGLIALLERQTDMVIAGVATNGEETLTQYPQLLPDVLLLDLELPDREGIALILHLFTQFPTACIVVLTSYGGDEDIYQSLRAGAKSYLLQETDTEEILTAIRKASTGESYLPHSIASKLVTRVNATSLTQRELEILSLIVAGMSNGEIGSALFISEGTVKSHINHILAKLEVEDRTQAVTTAIKRGIVHLK